MAHGRFLGHLALRVNTIPKELAEGTRLTVREEAGSIHIRTPGHRRGGNSTTRPETKLTVAALILITQSYCNCADDWKNIFTGNFARFHDGPADIR